MQDVKYLAGVSGGPDSMALLSMYQKQTKMVCHVNYHHRPTANRDASIVENYCKAHKIPCWILNVTPSIYKKYHKLSHNFQTIARLIRYDFFKLVSKKTKLSTILIAHNQDDFLETALMQKEKKSVALFYGINELTQWGDLKIYRPLLSIRKTQLLVFCKTKNIPYGIDETNEDDKYRRNKIRKEVNNWSSSKFKLVLNRILAYNIKRQKLHRLIDEEYVIWRKNNHDVQFFNQLNNKHKPYVMYKYLIDCCIYSISSNKIAQAIEFVERGKGKLRVTSNLAISKVNKQVKVVFL